MHREVDESEIDPMNATKRTVFFKKAKPSESQTIMELDSKSKTEVEIEQKSKPSDLQTNVSKVEDEVFEESDEQLTSLKKEIESARESHQKTKEKLDQKSKSLKKARNTLSQTKKQLDSVMASELSAFENKKLEVIGEMSSKMAPNIRF